MARRSTDFVTPTDQPLVRRLEGEDLAAVVELDAGGFGASRATLIGKLFTQSLGYGLVRGGRLCAFALCRRFGRGHVIGPVVAENDADAIAVIRHHVATHEGQFLRLDTPVEAGAFATFLSQSGLAVFDTVLAMSRPGKGGAVVVPGPNLYGLASHALG
jgi:hypothetical protein